MAAKQPAQCLKYQTTLGNRFRKIFEIIAPILMEGRLVFGPDGITIAGSSGDISVNLVLPCGGADSFASWPGAGPISMGLDFKRLDGWLRGVVRGDIIAFEISKADYEGPNPELTYKHWNEKMHHTVRLPILTLPTVSVSNKVACYKTILGLDAQEFSGFLSRHATGSKLVSLSSIVEDEKAFLVIKSGGIGSAETTRPCVLANSTLYDQSKLSCPKKNEVFHIKSLQNIAKAHALSPMLTVHLHCGAPLLLSYTLGQLGRVEFFLNATTPPPEKKTQVEEKVCGENGKPCPVPKRRRLKRKLGVNDRQLLDNLPPANQEAMSTLEL